MVFTVKTILLSTHRFVQVLAGSPLVYGSCSVHQLTFVKYFSLDQLLFLLAHFAAIFAQNSRTPTVQERENSNRKAGTASLWKRNRLHNKTLKVPFKRSFLDMQKPGPRGRSSSINPGPEAAVECKTQGVARGGDVGAWN